MTDPMSGLDRYLEESAGYFLSEKWGDCPITEEEGVVDPYGDCTVCGKNHLPEREELV